MQTAPMPAPNGFSYESLTAIERAIAELDGCLGRLRSTHELMMKRLDRETQPEVAPRQEPATPAITPWVKRIVRKGYDIGGVHTRCHSDIDIYVGILEHLWASHPDRRQAMADAMGRHGSNRSYVATTVQRLFPSWSLPRAQRHSRRLADGWFVDTNLNTERKMTLLPIAVRAAGLQWGEDVVAHWTDKIGPQE